MIDLSTIRTVFMGTPEFALPTFQGLIETGVNLCGVFTQPDRPRGRGKQLAPPPVKELALKHHIPIFQPEKLRDPVAVEQLRKLQPDLIVVVAYGQILPKSVLEIPRFGCINVHASLLPRYRGAAPINKAVVNGEQVTGVTTMLMDVGLDTGDMLIKRATEIGDEETAGELARSPVAARSGSDGGNPATTVRRNSEARTAGRSPEQLCLHDEKRGWSHRLAMFRQSYS